MENDGFGIVWWMRILPVTVQAGSGLRAVVLMPHPSLEFLIRLPKVKSLTSRVPIYVAMYQK